MSSLDGWAVSWRLRGVELWWLGSVELWVASGCRDLFLVLDRPVRGAMSAKRLSGRLRGLIRRPWSGMTSSISPLALRPSVPMEFQGSSCQVRTDLELEETKAYANGSPVPGDCGLGLPDARSASTSVVSMPARRSLAMTACRPAESPIAIRLSRRLRRFRFLPASLR